MDEQEIVDILKKQKLDHARPWKAISSDYLTTREFLSLIGIEGRGREYRQALFYLEIASKRDNNGHLLPDSLKKCFRDGSVRVHVFRSRSEGLIGVEYRIPVESLDERYAERIREIVSCRNGKAPDFDKPGDPEETEAAERDNPQEHFRDRRRVREPGDGRRSRERGRAVARDKGMTHPGRGTYGDVQHKGCDNVTMGDVHNGDVTIARRRCATMAMCHITDVTASQWPCDTMGMCNILRCATTGMYAQDTCAITNTRRQP